MTVSVLTGQQASTQSDTTSIFLLGTGSDSLPRCVLPRQVWNWYGQMEQIPVQK